MLKENYKPFMDLLKATYDKIYDDEKDEFTHADAMTLILFNLALNSLCDKLSKKIEEMDI